MHYLDAVLVDLDGNAPDTLFDYQDRRCERTQAGQFQPAAIHAAVARAHAICIESFPIIGGPLLAALVANQAGVIDAPARTGAGLSLVEARVASFSDALGKHFGGRIGSLTMLAFEISGRKAASGE